MTFLWESRIFAGTWNVSQEKASIESLRVWLSEPAAEASLMCVGLQEMEMGAGALGLAAVKETVSLTFMALAYIYIYTCMKFCNDIFKPLFYYEFRGAITHNLHGG